MLDTAREHERIIGSAERPDGSPPVRSGPLELTDLVGLDARLNNLISVSERTGRPELAPPRILVELVEAGRLGRKSGAGFYDYDADGNRR